MGLFTHGINKIEFAPIGVDGTVGTVFTQIGLTNIDSASLATEDGTTTDFFSEEHDLPEFSYTSEGKVTLTFDLMDPNLDAFARLWGGTVTGTGSAAVWERPRTITPLEQSVKITPKTGLVSTFPRMKIMPRLNSNLGKNSLFMISITCDILMPMDEDTAPMILGPTV